MNRLRGKLTYANFVATLALFLALAGGTAYAASHLGKGSVGTAQLKNGAVTGAKVKTGSLLSRDFAAGQVPAGPQGPAGQQGPAGPQRVKGDRGETGPSGRFPEALPHGQTLVGYVADSGVATAGGQLARHAISFPIPLASNPEARIIEPSGAGSTTACPGTYEQPKAAPGFLCVYEYAHTNVELADTFGDCVYSISEECGDADRFGGIYLAKTVAAGAFDAEAVWAVTAP